MTKHGMNYFKGKNCIAYDLYVDVMATVVPLAMRKSGVKRKVDMGTDQDYIRIYSIQYLT